MNKLASKWRSTYNEFPRTFWIVVTTTFIDRLGGSMLFPFFAFYITKRFNVGLSEVGVLFLIFSITSFIGSLSGGALTDRFGRRKMIIFSLVASSLSTAAMGLVNTLEGFFIIGFVSGLFTDVGGPAQQAIIADVLPEEKRAEGFGIIRVTFNLAVVFGPIIGGLVAARSYLALFLIDAVISIISAIIVYLTIPETKPAPHEHEVPETFGQTLLGYGKVFRDGIFMMFIFASMLSAFVYMNMNVTLGVFLRDTYGIPEDGYAYILSINAAMVVLFQFWITRRIEKRPPMLVMALGTLLYAVGFAMYGFVGTYGMFILAMVVITVGEMLVAPVGQALVASFAPEQMRGRYNAIFGNLAWGIPFAIGPWLAGLIVDNIDPNWLWYACGIVGMLSVLGYLILHRIHQPVTETETMPTEIPSPA
ncbi:MAG: MFS transporter [Anaerolineaceae bacterium]|nr:MAG: MFS transporter [Anaerolineaceae bacterium]